MGKLSKTDIASLHQKINCIQLLKYHCRGSFPYVYVPTFDNDTFVNINTQPTNMQGEQWIMIAKSRQILFS